MKMVICRFMLKYFPALTFLVHWVAKLECDRILSNMEHSVCELENLRKIERQTHLKTDSQRSEQEYIYFGEMFVRLKEWRRFLNKNDSQKVFESVKRLLNREVRI